MGFFRIKCGRLQDRSAPQGGFYIVLSSVLLVVIFGVVALAFDIGRAYYERRRIQNIVDVAATAAALKVYDANIQNVATPVLDEVQAIAFANGLKAEELLLPVQLGKWEGSPAVFTAYETKPSDNWNAVKVRAVRNVPVVFARAFGLRELTPSAEAVALMTATPGDCLKPFGLGGNLLDANPVGDTIYVSTESTSPGDWGKLDLGQGNIPADFSDAMMNGYCPDPIPQPGDPLCQLNGNAGGNGSQVAAVFQSLLNSGQAIMTLAVLDHFCTGQGCANSCDPTNPSTSNQILNYAKVELIAVNPSGVPECGNVNGGHKWCAVFNVLEYPTVVGGQPPTLDERALAQ